MKIDKRVFLCVTKMSYRIFAIFCMAILLAACSNADSAIAIRPSDDLLSSVCVNCEDFSSSSGFEKSCSSSVESSSSEVGCRTEYEDNCEYGELVDERDGKTYRTVKIGDQVWMAENLNYEMPWSYCYDGLDSNCIRYGRLYQWTEAEYACPVGWHLPDSSEWNTLIASVGGEKDAGRLLKSTTGWDIFYVDDEMIYDDNGTDAFGFSALPAGWRNDSFGVSFDCLGNETNFWSTSAAEDPYHCCDYVLILKLDGSTSVGYYLGRKSHNWHPVRCLRSNGTSPGMESSSSFAESSSSLVALTALCKTVTEDNCEYGELVDERDGQMYRTVKIGDQVWMAENLNYADSIKTPSLLNRSWCYNNEPDSCTKYGRLYTWAAAIDSVTFSTDAENVQGICPPGWHLPTNTEWNTLFSVGSSSTAGKILKSQMGWKEGINGADGVGFSALPAGSRSSGGFFDYVGGFAYFGVLLKNPTTWRTTCTCSILVVMRVWSKVRRTTLFPFVALRTSC